MASETHSPQRRRAVLGQVDASALLSAATSRLDGKRVAAGSNRRHRVILSSAMAYAVELQLFEKNPITDLKGNPSKTMFQVDRDDRGLKHRDGGHRSEHEKAQVIAG
ncbi:hypothetical protein AB0M95_02220 [Sphaerisporangium sp. NPDC051017]|uniref:hypothetical protein n=1 Tax=Sphaerisporangium sp. NPDC051017 TaxID=3154636 RepID=UPI00341DD9EF